MNHTTNYALPSWESTDRILMEDFNDAFETIDTQMKAHSDAIAGKAAQSTVNSLTQTVNTKANQSDLTALTQTVSGKADASVLTAETAARQAADDALAEKAGAQLIQRVTLSAAQEWVTLDMSEIDWTRWSAVAICARPVLASGDSYRAYCHTTGNTIDIPSAMTGEFLMYLLPFFSGSAPIRGLLLPGRYESSYLCYDTACSAMTDLEFGSTDHDLQAGSVFEIWGNR